MYNNMLKRCVLIQKGTMTRAMLKQRSILELHLNDLCLWPLIFLNLTTCISFSPGEEGVGIHNSILEIRTAVPTSNTCWQCYKVYL